MGMEDMVWCAILTFISVFCYWCINYIAAEIEMPFGDDANDLPVGRLQEGFNVALKMLMDTGCRDPPKLEMDAQHKGCPCMPCPFYLITDVQHHIFGEGSVQDEKLFK